MAQDVRLWARDCLYWSAVKMEFWTVLRPAHTLELIILVEGSVMAILAGQRLFIAASLFLLIGIVSPTLAQTPISADAVNPRYSVASLSPDGQFLALAMPEDGGDRVTVIDISNTANRPISYPIENAIVTDVIWRGNDALIIRVVGRFTIQITILDLAYLAFPKTTEPPKQITYRPQTSARISPGTYSYAGLSEVVDLAPDNESNFYMQAYIRRPPNGIHIFAESTADIWAKDLLRVEMPEGVSTIESLASRNTGEWIMDGSGNVVARIEVLPSGTQEIMLPRGDQFFTLTAIGGEASADGQIMGLAQDGRSLVIREVQGAEFVLYPIDLESGERGEPLFSGANYLREMRDDKSFRIIGARYAEGFTIEQGSLF